MDDSNKNTHKGPPNQPEEEEPIIDLIDEVEVPEADRAGSLSDLEKNLLEFERSFGAAPAAEPVEDRMAEGTLPELVALEDLDFEEEDEIPALTDPVADTLSLNDQNLDNLEQHLDWLFAEDSPPPAPETPTVKTSKPDEVIEIIDFEEQFLDAEEIPEEIPAEMYEHGPEEEETPEFLDIEEAEPDNELVWFDTLEPPDETPKDLAPHPPLMENLTAASLGRAAEPVPPTAMSPPEDIAAAVSAAAAAVSPAPASAASAAPPADGPSPAVDIDSIPMDRLEAAVANVIARSYSGRIEAIILQAIEKAVARDIERLRNELLDRDPEGKPV